MKALRVAFNAQRTPASKEIGIPTNKITLPRAIRQKCLDRRRATAERHVLCALSYCELAANEHPHGAGMDESQIQLD